MEISGYLVAEVCRNGHVTNSSLKPGESQSRFCASCGQATTRACSCGEPIRGRRRVRGIVDAGSRYAPPAYCHACGSAFPWTERRLEAARELIDEAGELSAEEKLELAGALDDLAGNTARTEVAVQRYKRLVKKVGTELATALRSIATDLVGEAARKSLFGA